MGGNVSAAKHQVWTSPARATVLRLLVAGQLTEEGGEAHIGDADDMAIASSVAGSTVDHNSLLKAVAEAHLEAMMWFDERNQGRISAGEPTSAGGA